MESKFRVGELVVAVPHEDNRRFIIEGYITGIYPNNNGSEGIVYDIDWENPFSEGEHSQYYIPEDRVFGSRLDMYIWKADYIKSLIADLSKELGEVNQSIREKGERVC